LSTIDKVNRLVTAMETTAPRSAALDSASPDSPADSPADEAWLLLRRLLFTERRRFVDVAAEFQLHPAQAGALMHMDKDSMLPMHQLASLMLCDSSNVTGIVDRLEARGLVSRQPSQEDRRVKYITLTPAGLEVRERMREAMAQIPAGIARLSEVDQRLLRDVLARALRFPGDER
jgi:DNA-binding MarR family transcriptional regulator